MRSNPCEYKSKKALTEYAGAVEWSDSAERKFG